MYKAILLSCLAVTYCSAGLLGGYKDVTNENDANVPALLAYTESELNKRINSIYKNKITEVKSIRRQLVNGYNYEINFLIESTECNQYSTKELESCKTTGKVNSCTVKVYSSFDGQTMDLNDLGCKGQSKRAMAGGWKDANPASFKDFAFRALQMQNSLMDASTVEVVRARVQVVAGQNIDLTVRGVENGKTMLCDINIWSQPWLKGDDSFKVMNYDCAEEPSKRGLAGGWSNMDADESKDYAFRALQKQNSLMDPETVEVVKARVQVVAGQNIMLTIRGKANGQSTLCDINIWSRPWLQGEDNFRVQKFDCAPEKAARGMLGGWSDKNPSEFKDYAFRALQKQNSLMDPQSVEVVKARTKVVAGTLVELTIRGKDNGKSTLCDISIWSRPWIKGEDNFQVNQFDCAEEKNTRQLGGRNCAGCVSDELPNPEDYKTELVEAVANENLLLDEQNTKILSVRKQIVAGTKYIMKIQTNKDGKDVVCNVSFVVSPWLAPPTRYFNWDC